MKMRWSASFCAALALCTACSDTAFTETVIVVEAEQSVRSRADHTTLVVSRRSQGSGADVRVHSDVETPRQAAFPYVIALTPSGSPTDLFHVEVSALEKGQAISVARLMSGYIKHQTRYVRLLLEDACIAGPTCADDQTCRAGICVDAQVDPATFSPERESAPTAGLTVPEDSGAGLAPDRPDARVRDAGMLTTDAGSGSKDPAAPVKDASTLASFTCPAGLSCSVLPTALGAQRFCSNYTSLGSFPPSCQSTADCISAGLLTTSCMPLEPFGNVCYQPCE